MSLVLKSGTSWAETYRRCMQVAPEAFDPDRIRNLIGGEWVRAGVPGEHRNPVDGSEIEGPPRIDHAEAERAVDGAVKQHQAWAGVGLEDRKARVARAVAAMREHRDLLAQLLVWEIGKPWRLACADVDRCLDGVVWYVQEADRQLAGRVPLAGPVSNIASWNYPMSVQVHAELIQVLAGNAVVAKTPSQGNFWNRPSSTITRPPPRPSSAGWKMKWTVPLKLLLSARYRAAPSSIVVWPSWPQACILFLLIEACAKVLRS